MTYFFIAGEASGDLHASNLIRALQQKDSSAKFIGLGGDKMQALGCHLVQHYRNMAFMGFLAVLMNLDKVRTNFRLARQALLETRPDVLVLVDYPSFNLRMAEFCRRHLPDTRIVYYIPPKIWAWKSWPASLILFYVFSRLSRLFMPNMVTNVNMLAIRLWIPCATSSPPILLNGKILLPFFRGPALVR